MNKRRQIMVSNRSSASRERGPSLKLAWQVMKPRK